MRESDQFCAVPLPTRSQEIYQCGHLVEKSVQKTSNTIAEDEGGKGASGL